MARDDAQVNFRIPHDLNERLKAAAIANKRSVTGELVTRLQRSLDEDEYFASSHKVADVASAIDPEQELAMTLAHLGMLTKQVNEVTSRLKKQAAQVTGWTTLGPEDFETAEEHPAERAPKKAAKKRR